MTTATTRLAELVYDALELTLAPTGAEEFRARFFDRAPLLVARDEPGRFDALLSSRDAEQMVCSHGARTPAFRLVRDGRQLPIREYTRDVRWSPGTFAGMAVPERVGAEFHAGATLVLQALQLHWPPAAHYCRGLEIALGFPVQANAYWTPATAQGFSVHHDTHDVFVLQVEGSKRWRVYAPVLELPLAAHKWSASGGDPGEPVMDFLLGPGDTLYLPRGWPHEAFTSDEPSLHVTVGLHPPRRVDALHAALDELAAEDVELRRALDPDGELPGDLLERLRPRLEREAISDRQRRRFVASRRPLRDDALRPPPEVHEDDLVQRRATVIADLDGSVLRFEGREVSFPPAAAAALEAVILADGPFSAADLPGPIDLPGRLVLVRRLLREGLLRPG